MVTSVLLTTTWTMLISWRTFDYLQSNLQVQVIFEFCLGFAAAKALQWSTLVAGIGIQKAMAEDDLYTKDGTVDCRGNPAKKNETGTWRACPYILGTKIICFSSGLSEVKIDISGKTYAPLLIFTVGNECCERLAYYGMSSNLVLFFKHRLGQHNATASKNVSDWSGTCYITPLIGAFFADAYLGRFWTIACFSIIYVLVISFRLKCICTNSFAT